MTCAQNLPSLHVRSLQGADVLGRVITSARRRFQDERIMNMKGIITRQGNSPMPSASPYQPHMLQLPKRHAKPSCWLPARARLKTQSELKTQSGSPPMSDQTRTRRKVKSGRIVSNPFAWERPGFSVGRGARFQRLSGDLITCGASRAANQALVTHRRQARRTCVYFARRGPSDLGKEDLEVAPHVRPERLQGQVVVARNTRLAHHNALRESRAFIGKVIILSIRGTTLARINAVRHYFGGWRRADVTVSLPGARRRRRGNDRRDNLVRFPAHRHFEVTEGRRRST